MRRGTLIALCAVASVVAFDSGPAEAQVDGYHMTGINFNFANPGARARGIGGAFVALADDATAGIANPAGLAYLDRQVTLEYMRDQEEAPVGQVTQGSVDVVGSAPLYTFTAVGDPMRVSSDSTTNRLNHASFVLPIPKARLGLSAYYASLANLEQDYEVGSGLMCLDNGSPFLPRGGAGCTGPFDDSYGEFYPAFDVSARLESELIGAGVGFAFSDRFSIGASVGYVTTELDGTSITPGFVADDGTVLATYRRYTSTVDDSDLMYTLGLLYRGDLFGFGVSYRSQADFEITNEKYIDEVATVPIDEFDGEFRIPERIAAGVSFFPGDRWVIAAEYVRIPYSTMPDGMPTQFDELRQSEGVAYDSSDVSEVHVGGEYTTFSDNRGISIRVGYWREQTHLIYSSQGYPETIEDPQANFSARTLAGASLLYDELDLDFDHFTAGVGAAFGMVRLDAAVDYSPDGGTDFLLSGVLYF